MNIWYSKNAGLADHVRCIRQLVQIAEKSVKFLSSLLETDQFIVKNVIQNIENTDCIKNVLDYQFKIFFFDLFFKTIELSNNDRKSSSANLS